MKAREEAEYEVYRLKTTVEYYRAVLDADDISVIKSMDTIRAHSGHIIPPIENIQKEYHDVPATGPYNSIAICKYDKILIYYSWGVIEEIPKKPSNVWTYCYLFKHDLHMYDNIYPRILSADGFEYIGEKAKTFTAPPDPTFMITDGHIVINGKMIYSAENHINAAEYFIAHDVIILGTDEFWIGIDMNGKEFGRCAVQKGTVIGLHWNKKMICFIDDNDMIFSIPFFIVKKLILIR